MKLNFKCGGGGVLHNNFHMKLSFIGDSGGVYGTLQRLGCIPGGYCLGLHLWTDKNAHIIY